LSARTVLPQSFGPNDDKLSGQCLSAWFGDHFFEAEGLNGYWAAGAYLMMKVCSNGRVPIVAAGTWPLRHRRVFQASTTLP
jgi:hypothetical protein